MISSWRQEPIVSLSLVLPTQPANNNLNRAHIVIGRVARPFFSRVARYPLTFFFFSDQTNRERHTQTSAAAAQADVRKNYSGQIIKRREINFSFDWFFSYFPHL
jgi:exosome complex RNA-binding protein Csl4